MPSQIATRLAEKLGLRPEFALPIIDADLAPVREALSSHSVHPITCPASVRDEYGCTCGLQAALDALKVDQDA